MEEPKHLDELDTLNIASECYVVKNGQVLMFKRSDTASSSLVIGSVLEGTLTLTKMLSLRPCGRSKRKLE